MEQKGRSCFKKNDGILIGIILATGIVIGTIYFLQAQTGTQVLVKCDGTIVATYSLEEEGEYRIETPDGGYNLLKIEEQKAYLLDADCPDLLCVGMGKISKSGQNIICIPHKLVIEVPAPRGVLENEFDGVVQ